MTVRSPPAAARPTFRTATSIEREADAVADAAMSAPLSASLPSAPAMRAAAPRSTVTPGGAWLPNATAGTKLEPAVRREMETRFGHDFGAVRIHDGERAARAARQLRADAYALGPHIVFGQGRYAPGDAGGKRLLAHELGHVVQQGASAGALRGAARTLPIRERAPLAPACAPAIDHMNAEDRIEVASKALDALADRVKANKQSVTPSDSIAAMDAIRLARRAAGLSKDEQLIEQADALIGRFDIVTQGTQAARPDVFELHPAASDEPLRHDAGKDEAHTVVTAQRGFATGIPAKDIGALRTQIDDLQKKIEEKTRNANDAAARTEIETMQRDLERMRQKLSTATPVLKDLPTLNSKRGELQKKLDGLPKTAKAQTRTSLQNQIAALDVQIAAVGMVSPDDSQPVPRGALQGGGRLGHSGQTYVTVQILDANNKLIATVQARNEGNGGLHAEDVILKKLEELPDKTRLAGATMLVDGDQEVCKKCDVTLKNFAAANKLKEVLNNTTVAPTLDSSGQLTGNLGKAKTLAGKIANPAAIDKLEGAGANPVTVPVQTRVAGSGTPTGGGTGDDGPPAPSGSNMPRVTYEGPGDAVAPIAEHGPSPFRTAAAEGATQLVQWASSKFTEMHDDYERKLANDEMQRQIGGVKAMWEQHPEYGVLFTITWNIQHHEAGELRNFVSCVPRYGINRQEALNDRAVFMVEQPDLRDEVTYDETWIDPPQPLSGYQQPAPFRKIAIATFAGDNEVQDVKWRGRSTFDDAGFTTLKPVKGAQAQFYVLMPPSDITFMDNGDQHNTNVPIRHRSAPGGWTIPVVDLDTLVGLIPFVDHDTAAMVYPVDRYTELLFKGSSPVDTQQLRRYAFANVRFVPPKSIQVLQSLDESEMPTPDSLADMTPADWAQLSLIVHGEAAQELIARLSKMPGSMKVTPEFMQEFLSMLPMDLTMAEVDALTDFKGKPADMTQEELLTGWRAAIERVRGGAPTSSSDAAPDAAYVTDKLKGINWTGLKGGSYYRQENGEGGPVGMPTGTVVDCICYILVGQSRQGLLVTLEVQEKDGEFTPINVTAIRSPRYSIDGATISDGKEMLGVHRIKPVKRDGGTEQSPDKPKAAKP
jgi:hypothetical protein